MRGLKETGVKEVDQLLNRVGRQYGLQRISQEDHDELKAHLRAVRQRIEIMEEVNPDGHLRQ